jgi:hypothetical protein
MRLTAGTGLMLALLAACKREPATGDAGAEGSSPARVPAPNSPLARELGTDDAGRGEYRAFDDGPWCGFSPRVDRKVSLGTSYEAEDASYAFFATERAPPDGPRDEAQKTMLELTLRGPSRVVASGRIRIELSLANRSPNPLVFSKAIDGSFEHWRSPFTDLYARDEKTGRTYRWTHGADFGRCGNLDPRKKEDLVRLAPGGKKADPFGREIVPAIARPGRYTLWLVYAACEGAERRSDFGEEPVPPDLFDGTIASNGITVEVTAPP